MSHRALLAAAGAQGKLYSEDVFSAYPYAGNGSTQTITNGIDLTKGGLVWVKGRSGATSHVLSDTIRGAGIFVSTDTPTAESSQPTWISGFSSNGFSMGSGAFNTSGSTYASWTFRRAPKFFDVVTWTGDGASNRQIPHALGIAPGMVTAKRRDAAGDWAVWHRSATGDLYLDTTAAQTASFTQITAASATTFSVSGNANILNATYVAYAWAHDPDTVNGIVQCGTFTDATRVQLGWEPQFVIVKSTGAVGSWYMSDTSRAMSYSANNLLQANASSSEAAQSGWMIPDATGFTSSGGVSGVYLAIRRGPMRTPTSGASVYNAIARTGTGAAATVTGVGFAPDLLIGRARAVSAHTWVIDRLRGRAASVVTDSTSTETSSTSGTDVASFDSSGFSFGTQNQIPLNVSAQTEIDWQFARAPGFFDIVCYKGTGANQTLAHNLGVAPGMMWIKDRTTAQDWFVYHSALGVSNILFLDANGSTVSYGAGLNSTAPTSTALTVGSAPRTGASGDNYVAYLFGEVPGVSKIFSFTGNGSSQTVNCGFASGARFVLLKRTDAAGDWIVADTTRGIVAAADPCLALNSTAAEVTTADWLDPASTGFIVNQEATFNANVNGAQYIGLAIA